MWCPGCGNGIVLGALLRAFEELGYENGDTVVVTGIGCWGKADDYLATCALHVTHGRALAFATGIKVYKPELNVVVLMGDGDGVTIGGNHFIHAARRNIDLTAVIVNNFNYGMTGGQVSATTGADRYTSTTPYGNPEREFDICALAGAAGANYAARETVFDGWQLQQRMKEGLTRKGFALVEAVSPCPTHFGRYNQIDGPDLLRRLREVAGDGLVCGLLIDRNAPDFNARYREVQAWAQKRNDRN
jgi:2-oxoglutarate ferredoxin oxidoreductase subunit beta